MRSLALIRGINVGGNSLVKMAELKAVLEQAGFGNVITYIQSGNVFFDSNNPDQLAVASQISAHIKARFDVGAAVVVFTRKEWQAVIDHAPSWWGKDNSRKHNLLILLPPYDMGDTLKAVGELKPEIETMEPGEGVLYQSMSLKLFGRTTTGKLASSPTYKRLTVRNYNTVTKLLNLFGGR